MSNFTEAQNQALIDALRPAVKWQGEQVIGRMMDVDSAEFVLETLGPVIRKLQADAWGAGYVAGHSNAMRRMSDEPKAPTSPNPYRVETPKAGDPS